MTTPTPSRFDGHGINDAEGQRGSAKETSTGPYVYPDVSHCAMRSLINCLN